MHWAPRQKMNPQPGLIAMDLTVWTLETSTWSAEKFIKISSGVSEIWPGNVKSRGHVCLSRRMYRVHSNSSALSMSKPWSWWAQFHTSKSSSQNRKNANITTKLINLTHFCLPGAWWWRGERLFGHERLFEWIQYLVSLAWVEWWLGAAHH